MESPVLSTSPTSDRTFIIALSATNALLFIGASAMLPLLPSFLRQTGSSTALVGLVMAAYFAGSVLTQYPVGRLCDRVGARPVLFFGLVIFAIGSFGFALTAGAVAAIAFRSLQGIGASAVSVAAGAAIGIQVDRRRQGRAFGAIFASQMFALAIGPLVGSIAGLTWIRQLFIAAGVIALCAWFPVSRQLHLDRRPRTLEVERTPIEDIATREGFTTTRVVSLLHRKRSISTVPPALVGAIAYFAALGFLAGAYESCWTLLLDARGASSFAIGLSWTLFALPFALLSVPAGHVAERVNRRRLAMVSIVVSAGFAATYPFLHSVEWLVGLGTIEALCAVFGGPSAMMIVTHSVGIAEQGAAQGAVGTARTATTALAAAVSGALFGVNAALPFIVAAAVVVAVVASLSLTWREV